MLASVAFYLLKSGKELIHEPLVKAIISGRGVKLKDIQYVQDDPDKGLKWVLDAQEVRFSEDKKTILFNDFHLKVEPQDRPFLYMGSRLSKTPELLEDGRHRWIHPEI